ncbi:MAG: arginine--tRNA ligase [Candidatus Obscuribacter sp.]|nr:arginine--tRNA ligase [Candidatus Obscuribacter sp.]MBK9772287.1 arginine--tRNA ligase [Candidatus Obscuribacter sp.]MBL0188483.1 arginine--tRNA ligase [Candidatus Obscuribacter sp.]MBP6350804.1 arginine--tRNA ligase [Candidatus Obscuribacter sp.]MBP6593711.1 arginine--tRNA ligase [Candidatus Obscuribacter sp.]
MIKEKLTAIVADAFAKAAAAGQMGALESCPVAVQIEKPKFASHGDLACGIALKLAGPVKMAPLKIAQTLAQYIEQDKDAASKNIAQVTVAPPGFINFKLGHGWLNQCLSDIVSQGDSYGRVDIGQGKRVLVEYVSANPTGDLHIGHGRGAVFGSCLSNLLKFAGYNVEQEFYINDAGEQIVQLGRCAFALYRRQLGVEVEYPTEGYPEEFLIEFVEPIVKRDGKAYLELNELDGALKLSDLTTAIIIEHQKALLSRLHIDFDRWYSERALHDSGKVQDVLEEFKKHGYSYEKEGALWLKNTELGDERDRVLRKSSGATTYLANDAAYHLDKYRRGYDLVINIWGADHHGQVPGLKGAMKALGQDESRLEVLLTQIVNLSRDGQIVRMSKRMGTVVMLSEVMDEVGVDAVRYYLAESSPQNSINFDLELAKKSGRENPAFYIQYAHARCCSILRKALEPSTSEDGTVSAPITESQWQEFINEYKTNPELFNFIFDENEEILAHQKALLARLETFSEEVSEAVATRQPGKLARYAFELACELQKFYEVSRVISDQLSVTKARLGLILATKQVLSNALGIIGVSAPERM